MASFPSLLLISQLVSSAFCQENIFLALEIQQEISGGRCFGGKVLPWSIRTCWSSCFTLFYCLKRCRFEIQIPRWLWVPLNRGRHHGTCPVLIPQTQFQPPKHWPYNINSFFLHFPIIRIFCIWNASCLSSLKSLFPMRIWTYERWNDGEASCSLLIFMLSPHHLQWFFLYVHHINPTQSLFSCTIIQARAKCR